VPGGNTSAHVNEIIPIWCRTFVWGRPRGCPYEHNTLSYRVKM